MGPRPKKGANDDGEKTARSTRENKARRRTRATLLGPGAATERPALDGLILPRRRATVPIDVLLIPPRNPNDGDVDAIAESIRATGFWGAIGAQEGTNRVIYGAHRVAALRRLGVVEVPVDFYPVPDDVADEMMIADNAVAERGRRDPEKLLAVLLELRAKPTFNLAATGLPGLPSAEPVLARLRELSGAGLRGPGLPPVTERGAGAGDGAEGGGRGASGAETGKKEPPERHALSIVLTQAEKRRWDAWRGKRGDKEAFLALLAEATGS